MANYAREITLQDVPDITSDRLAELGKLRINSVHQLAVQTPAELAMEINDAYFDAESAARLIGNARKILTENQVLSKDFLTADNLLEKRNKISRYATGSSNFDSILNGGFETQAITEIAGDLEHL
jgi:DNA repair protein RadA